MGSHTTGPIPSSMDESFLLWSVQRGEPGAFRTFLERYEIQIFSLLTALVGDSANADRLAEDVFVEVHRSIGKFKGNISPLAWLYQITVRHVMGTIHKGKYGPADPVRQRAFEAMEKLNENERVLLLLRDVQGLSVSALSGLFRVDEEAIRSTLLRARRRAVGLTINTNNR
jgi:RNA polymerase sigma-70 factor (ECF subfamily)